MFDDRFTVSNNETKRVKFGRVSTTVAACSPAARNATIECRFGSFSIRRQNPKSGAKVGGRSGFRAMHFARLVESSDFAESHTYGESYRETVNNVIYIYL